jgi:phosphoadenylyl-sulfate reductase (thioredoxin)
MNREAIRQGAAAMEDWPAERILAWAARGHGRVVFSTGFGAEGCALVHFIASARLPIHIFTLDTGLLFPETHALWRRLEQRYGINIEGVRPPQSVDEQAATEGAALWMRDPDRCCALRKVDPLRQALQGADVWISAIRRDQTPERADAPVVQWDQRHGLLKVNPLVRWSSRHVWQFLHANGIPYNPLHDDGYPSIGCQPCTSRVAEGEDPRAGRWRGREKQECGLHLLPVTLQQQGDRV